MPAVFITGSGTGAGKTFVAASLLALYRGLGQKVSALKPVVSGFDPASPEDSDPAMLLKALGRSANAEEIAQISPWRFRAPLSPDMAARAEGRTIDFEKVVDFCRAKAAAAGGTMLVEGIGGIMVPLGPQHTVLDLIAALDFPLILVGGSYVGTLSHMLTAHDAISRRGLNLRAAVISESEGNPPPLDETLTTLENFVAAPVIGVPRRDKAAAARAVQRLAGLIA